MLTKVTSVSKPSVYLESYTSKLKLVSLNIGLIRISPDVEVLMPESQDAVPQFEFYSLTHSTPRTTPPSFSDILDIIYTTGIAPLVTAEEFLAIAEGMKEENPLPLVRDLKLRIIQDYDSSDRVNRFYYQDHAVWLDKSTRVGLVNSTTILRSVGETHTTLWLDNMPVTIPVDDTLAMLAQIELYAIQCYNQTALHLSRVSSLDSLSALVSYDHTEGYPPYLHLG